MKSYYFSHGRTALKYGLSSLGLKPGDEILIPDYICDVVLHPLKSLGLKYQFYPVLDDLSPNWDELEKIVRVNSIAILMVHYFGQPQNIPVFQNFCKIHKLFLVEDNAHGFCGKHEGQLLGTFGEIGISSPRKTLELPSGGILYINWSKNQLIENLINNLKTLQINFLKESMKRKLKRSNFFNHFARKHLKPRPVYWDPRAFCEKEIHDWRIDSFSKKIINQVSDSSVRRYRKQAYFNWNSFAIKNGLKPVIPKLGQEASPLVFPAYTSGPSESRFWFDWGWEHGYNISSWPSLPDEIIKKGGDGLNRWNRLICFPIEQII